MRLLICTAMLAGIATAQQIPTVWVVGDSTASNVNH